MKRLAYIYVIFLHLALAGVLLKSDFLNRNVEPEAVKIEIPAYYHRVLGYHSRSVDVVPDGAVIFIGDSITQGLSVAAVHPLGVNYGIGGDTTRGVLERLETYLPALRRAGAIVVAVGINDGQYRCVEEAIRNYDQILDTLPQDRRVVVSAILPFTNEKHGTEILDPKWVERFNSELEHLASEREWVEFVDASKGLDADNDGRLDAPFQVGDGVHLNSTGYAVWIPCLKNAIQKHKPAE